MTFFSHFALFFGAFLALIALIALIAGWLFRSSTAWLGWKLILPAAIVALALYTPYAISGLLGLPVPTTMASLPESAQLLAFVPHDEDKLVDVWLLDGPIPRAYQVLLDKPLKKLLQEAQGEMAAGRPVFLRKKAKPASGAAKPAKGLPAVTTLQDDFEPEYELDASAAGRLPAKN